MEPRPWKRPDRIRGFFKFGERRHMEELLHEGHLYMNTLAYYTKLERNDVRADADEGIDHTIEADGASLSMESEGAMKPLATIIGSMRYRRTDPATINVYCLHTLAGDTTIVESGNLRFGDTYVAITQGDDFIRRVQVEKERLQLPLKWDLVEYVDLDRRSGPVGPFRKSIAFAHESEWRIALSPGPGEPFSLRIGDLSDIAKIGPLQALNDRLQVVEGSLGIWGTP